MLRSLHGRLLILLALLALAASAAGVLMMDLYQQSATAQVGQAKAEIGRACDAIAAAYRFYSDTHRQRPVFSLDDAQLRRDLTAVVLASLRKRPSVEGGIWQAKVGSLAYAFPTYEGARPKTDLPQAEIPRIRAINATALKEQRQASLQYTGSSQTVLFTACPLSGPVPDLTAWTMTRVFTFGGRAYQQLVLGLSVLFAAVVSATVLLTRLMMIWSRHVSGIEKTLKAHDIAKLPSLPMTGELELDRIITALNEAGLRLADARQRAEDLARQVATGERLAAIGRIAAGVAHEIRNPIAAMRLKAENALAGDTERKGQALLAMLGQIERLDSLLRRLLNITERNEPNLKPVVLGAFLESCVAAHTERAAVKNITLRHRAHAEQGCFDPEQMRSALDNLILNAIAASPPESQVIITAALQGESLILSVSDQGPGPPPDIREHLFEPFVTGRPDGTGLGLSVVCEVAKAHSGTVELITANNGTCFRIAIPWQLS